MARLEGTAKDVVLGGNVGSKMRARPSLPAKTSSSSKSLPVFRETYWPDDMLEAQLLGFKRCVGGLPKFAFLTNECSIGGANCADCGWVWVNRYEMRCSVALRAARVASSHSSKTKSSSSLIDNSKVMEFA